MLKQLEDWVNGHKARHCDISIDNGYGATSWDVVLWHENGVVKTIEGYGEIMIYNKSKGHKPLSELFYNDYEILKLDNDDWAGLEKTLEAALSRVNYE